MRSRCNLTYLNIESNSVGRSAIVHLGKAVKHNPSLIQLRIGGNTYGNGKSFVKFSKLLGERVWKNVLGKLSTTVVNTDTRTTDFIASKHPFISSLTLSKVWDNLIELDLSRQRLMCSDGVVLGNVLRYNGSHTHSLCSLNLSANFLWHTTSSRTRGSVSGLVEIFNFVRVARKLKRMDISDNIVESKKDADSIAKAISRAIGVVIFSKGQTNFIPVCPLQWLGMQRCGIPSSKVKYEGLCRDVERTWALVFFHETLSQAYEDYNKGKGFTFLPEDTVMPLTIAGRTDGEYLHIFFSRYKSAN